MSAKPTPQPLPIVAAVVIAIAVHVTRGCTALEIPRGTRVPAVNPNSVPKSIASCAAGFTILESAMGACSDAPATANIPDTATPTPRRRISGPRNAGGVGTDFDGVFAMDAVGAAALGRERADTTAAVEVKLKNQPPQTSSSNFAAFGADGVGDSGRVTRVGTKNTGSHLRDMDEDRGPKSIRR